MVTIPDLMLERQLLAQGYESIIGVDEVGMGSLAGPVVACAVAVLPHGYQNQLDGIRDSKQLSPSQRLQLATVLKSHEGISWAVRWCSAATVDRLNIYRASRLAMRRAISALRIGQNPIVLVDGNKRIERIKHPQIAIVKGDRSVWAVAAASILAKVYRDAMMVRYAKRYPAYHFEFHKGYGTPGHRECLLKYGPCALHRKSFKVHTETLIRSEMPICRAKVEEIQEP